MKNICVHCGKEFYALSSRKMFCSNLCKNAHRNKEKNKILKCKFCGRKFLTNKDNQKYCSRECFNKSKTPKSKRRAKRKEEIKKITHAPLTRCPWEHGEIRGTAANADPVLGF